MQAFSSIDMAQKEEQAKVSFLNKMKEKWGLQSLFQVVIVMVVFSLTGMTVVFVRPLIFSWFGYDELTPFWIKAITYLLLIFPLYQILILVYGTILGQFSFFWEKEKKLIRAISGLFHAKGSGN